MSEKVKKISNFLKGHKIPLKNRLIYSIIVNLAFVFSIFIFIPFETFLGNIEEFNFPFFELVPPVVFIGTAIFVAMTVVELLFRGLFYKIILAGVFGVTLASYIQGMFLNGIMKTLDGSKDGWSFSQKLINLAIWGIIVLIPIVFVFFKNKLWITICRFGSILIIGMQTVALLSLTLTASNPTFDYRMTDTGLYEVAKENNVIMFVLDRFDQKRIDEMLADDPSFFDKFKGFKYYPDTTGIYTFTHNAIPYLVTGMELEDFYPTTEDKSTAIANSDFLKAVKKKTGHMGFYTEEQFFECDAAATEGVADNVISVPIVLNDRILSVAAIKSSLYRITPFIFKNRFNYTSNNFNAAVSAGSDELTLYQTASHYYDSLFLDKLEASGLTINKDYGDSCFRFIHLMGGHYPYQLTAEGEYVEEETQQVESCKGEFYILYKYFEELERLGLYKDATIIITADHGDAYIAFKEEDLVPNTNPILFYKPSGASWNDNFVTSSAPASQADIYPTIMNALGVEVDTASKNKPSFNGVPLNKLEGTTSRKRYFYCGVQNPEITEYQSCISVEFEINGDARNIDNWKKSGRRTYTKNTNHGFEAVIPD